METIKINNDVLKRISDKEKASTEKTKLRKYIVKCMHNKICAKCEKENVIIHTDEVPAINFGPLNTCRHSCPDCGYETYISACELYRNHE